VPLAVAVTALILAAPAVAQTQRPGPNETTAAKSAVILSDSPVWLGTVRLPMRVKADGQTLAPGAYRVRLTGEHARDTAAGQSAQLERWVEFVQGGQVKGRALAPVVPAADATVVTEGRPPARGNVRVERLKGDDYYRVWFNHRGEQVLIYLPLA
jgi:hypothetical protein